MTRIAVSRVIGEGIFNYEFSWRTNSEIIGAFIGFLARAKVEKWAMIKLCFNVFDIVWCVGLEEAIMNIDAKLKIPLREMYMVHPHGRFYLAIITRHPSLVMQENASFYQEWLKMDANI